MATGCSRTSSDGICVGQSGLIFTSSHPIRRKGLSDTCMGREGNSCIYFVLSTQILQFGPNRGHLSNRDTSSGPNSTPLKHTTPSEMRTPPKIQKCAKINLIASFTANIYSVQLTHCWMSGTITELLASSMEQR